MVRDFTKNKLNIQKTQVRICFYENLGRLNNKDTRDVGLRNLEKVMTDNCNEESLKVFLNCLASSTAGTSQMVQDNEVLVLGKLIETFHFYFNLSGAILSVTKILKDDENKQGGEFRSDQI